jgi:hypothetical protein
MNHEEVLAVFLINRDEAKSIKEIAQVIGGQSYVEDLRAVLRRYCFTFLQHRTQIANSQLAVRPIAYTDASKSDIYFKSEFDYLPIFRNAFAYQPLRGLLS